MRVSDGPLQEFLATSPWDYRLVGQEIRAAFAEHLVPSTAHWGIGTVGVLDESGFPKKGTDSVGVARQWCGRLGKKDNCQVGVFLVGVTPAGCALLDHQICPPEDWVLDRGRRAEVGVPRSVTFRTKPEIGLDLRARVRAGGQASFVWLVFDDLDGREEERHCLTIPKWPGPTIESASSAPFQRPSVAGKDATSFILL